MKENDIFRPHHEPAATFYDGIIRKAQLRRKAASCDEWIKNERENVWEMARDYAQKNGFVVPTMAQIEAAESSACGHSEYASKWALGVADLFRLK